MPRNPYQGMYGNNPGFGSNFSYGQQGGNNPYGQAQRGSANYGQSYQGSPRGYPGGGQRDVGSQNYWDRPNQGWGDQWSRDGGGGYPGQQQRMPQPPAGKGRGMGGIGGGVGGYGGGMMSRQRGIAGDPLRGNDPFQIYGNLLQQRGMEQQLGMDPGAAWNMPMGVPGYERQHSPLWQGLYPGQGGGF